MLDKILEETQCHPDLVVSWCINGKNSFHDIHGFSPYQLLIGKNPKLPSTLNKNVPAPTRYVATYMPYIGQEKPSLPMKTLEKSDVLYLLI